MTTLSRIIPVTRFSKTYKEGVFHAWWPNRITTPLSTIVASLPLSEDGTRPEVGAVRAWIARERWIERAEMLEAQVSKRLEKMALEGRVEMLNRHAQVGKELQEKALAYLQTTEIVRMSDAIKLVELGIDVERSSRGVGDAIVKMANSSSDELNNIIAGVLNNVTPEDAKALLTMDMNIDIVDMVEDGPVIEEGEYIEEPSDEN